MLPALAFLPPRLPPLFPGYSSRRAPAREASDGTTFSFRLVLCEGKASKEKPHLHAKVAATDDIHPLSPARRRVHTVPPYALRASAALEPEFLVRVSAPVLGGFCWSELTCVPSWLLALSVPLAASSATEADELSGQGHDRTHALASTPTHTGEESGAKRTWAGRRTIHAAHHSVGHPTSLRPSSHRPSWRCDPGTLAGR